VIPETSCRECGATGTKRGGLVPQQDLQQKVVIDNDATAHARSESSATAFETSDA
jgi:hypothetical protein